MNFNEEVPDHLGGHGEVLPADVLKTVYELLERLHQAGHANQGSHYQFVYVAPGGQHVETQNINLTPGPSPKGEGKPLPSPPQKGREYRLPEVLATNEAMVLWKKAQAAGYVDANYQPLISRTQSALLADAMAERLDIKEKWKVFETLWNRKYMRSDYNLALTRKGSLDFQDELKQLFG
jgi:hypothetical protein